MLGILCAIKAQSKGPSGHFPCHSAGEDVLVFLVADGIVMPYET